MTPHPYGWLSLLPPIVAIILAIATRRIVFSLVTGIFAGALLMAGGNPWLAMYHTWETHLWSTLINPSKLRVFSFTLLMGAMVGVISRSGGMRGLIELVSPYASNRRRGQLATWLMGLLVFFDDYANTILLGSTLRPICDRLKISREKLAYLVDSTAAPVAGLAPLSTWVAVEIDYIGSGLESISNETLSAFPLFLASIPYRFYIWAALLLVPISALWGRDLGAMQKAEQRAVDGIRPDPADETSNGDSETTSRTASWYYAVLPIAFTLTLVVYLVYSTGARGACASAASAAVDAASMLVPDPSQPIESHLAAVTTAASNVDLHGTGAAITALGRAVAGSTGISVDALPAAFTPKLSARDVLGEADSSLALQYGSLAGLCLAIILPRLSRSLTFEELTRGAVAGARTMLPAVAILWTASAMSNMTTDVSVQGARTSTPYEFQDHRLYTADYLTTVISGDATDPGSTPGTNLSAKFLPTVVFVLASLVAFCTGTSWGTMGILVPVVIQSANALLAQGGASMAPNDPILLGAIGGVLAGAVFGDHCSPISDTTVLSSQSCGCDHLAHVWTQLPYALVAAGVSILLGTIPIGFGVSLWFVLPLQFLALVCLIRVFGKTTEAAPAATAQ